MQFDLVLFYVFISTLSLIPLHFIFFSIINSFPCFCYKWRYRFLSCIATLFLVGMSLFYFIDFRIFDSNALWLMSFIYRMFKKLRNPMVKRFFFHLVKNTE